MSLKTIWEGLEKVLDRAGRARALRQLRTLDDRFLEDCGISPDLLERGIDAWPWRARPATAEPVCPTVAGIAANARTGVLSRAVAELSAYSDEELVDLGISRHDIARAVRFGREELEGAHRHAA